MKRSITLWLLCAAAGLTCAWAALRPFESAQASQSTSPAAPQANLPQLIKDINPGGSAIYTQLDKTQMIAVGDSVFFNAQDNEHGFELWVSRGAPDNTQMVKDIHPTDDSWPTAFANLNGELFFAADDGVNGLELWKSDGSAAGTQLVKDIYPGIGSSSPVNLTASGGNIYFVANDSQHAFELWKSDGTAAGTQMVKEITPGNDLVWPYQYQIGLIDLNGMLFFASYGGASQYDWDLWRSDGTLTGTVMVKDFYGSMLENQTVMGNDLYFTVFQGSYGSELWKTDSATGDAVLVKNINPTYGDSSNPANLTVSDGVLYFSADDGVHGAELWKSDGASEGTVMVQDIHPTAGSFAAGCENPPCMVNVDGMLFFAADDGVHGLELWKSDGSSAGTSLVKDLRSGNDGNPGGMTAAQGLLFFVVPNDIGNGLWVSDGAAEGTVMLKNYTGAAPALLTVAGERLFFAADDESGIGKELWGVYLGQLVTLFMPLLMR